MIQKKHQKRGGQKYFGRNKCIESPGTHHYLAYIDILFHFIALYFYLCRLAAAKNEADGMQLDLDKLRIYESELNGHCHKMQQRGLEAEQELNTLGKSVSLMWSGHTVLLIYICMYSNLSFKCGPP